MIIQLVCDILFCTSVTDCHDASDGDLIGWRRFRSAGMLRLVGWYIVTDGLRVCN
jgi:hypothetical protein